MMDENFDKVFRQGSDVSHGAIDNSSQGLAQREIVADPRRGGLGRFTNVFNAGAYHGGVNTPGAPGVESFHIPGWDQSGTGEREAYPEFRRRQLEEAAIRSNPTARINMNAALSGTPTSVNGTGRIDVNVAAPSTPAASSGLFKRIQQRRDIQMQPSASGPEQFSGSPL